MIGWCWALSRVRVCNTGEIIIIYETFRGVKRLVVHCSRRSEYDDVMILYTAGKRYDNNIV